MMGWHHSIGGATAYIALTTTPLLTPTTTATATHWANNHLGFAAPIAQQALETITLNPAPLSATLALTAVASGAALIPDLDHHNSTATRSAGFVTSLAQSAVSTVATHRGATHSFAAIIAALALWPFIAHITTETPWGTQFPTGNFIAATFTIGFALIARKLLKTKKSAWLIALTVSAAISVLAPHYWINLGAAIGIGMAAHIVGDILTTDGTPPVTWPIRIKPLKILPTIIFKTNGNIAFPLAGKTGSKQEYIVAAATVIAFIFFTYTAIQNNHTWF